VQCMAQSDGEVMQAMRHRAGLAGGGRGWALALPDDVHMDGHVDEHVDVRASASD